MPRESGASSNPRRPFSIRTVTEYWIVPLELVIGLAYKRDPVADDDSTRLFEETNND
jgi:hypothetical protein